VRIEQLKPRAWVYTGAGILTAGAGVYGMFGWPAAALFVGGWLIVFGVLIAAAAGAAAGGRR